MTGPADALPTPAGTAGDEPALVHAFFERAVAKAPDHIAVDVPPGPTRPERQTTTYARLAAQVAAVAACLRRVIDGECVIAIRLPRDSHHLLAAQLGVLSAGAAYTCLDPAFPAAHARFLVEDSGAVLVLTDRHAHEPAAHEVGLPADRVVDVVDLIDATSAPPAAPSPAPPWLMPASLAYVIYTSGSTGRPKGVMIEHRSLANLVASDLETFALGAEDRVAQSSSAAYDSSVEETWLALAAGATLVVMDDDAVRLGPDLVDWLREERISVFCPPPTLLRATGCLDPRSALPDLRLLYVGGEPLPQTLADRWAPGRRLENGYGPTECTVTALRCRIRRGEPVRIGRPVRGQQAWVLDPALDEVADGGEGELCLGGIGLARGYRNRPQLTAERFPLHPRLGRIYRTGDRVSRDPDGGFRFLGRLDGQVKIRGYRVELGEIEARLGALPGVREAACRLQDQGGEALLAAFIVPERAAAPPSIPDLKAALRESLPAHMVPSRFAILSRLPTSVGGKLERKALPVIAAVSREQSREFVAPRNETEQRVAAAFQSALELGGEVSVGDDFFTDLGGDSLAAAVLISMLRDDPATAGLSVRDLYAAPTVAGLAQLAQETGAQKTGAQDAGAAETGPAHGHPLAATAAQGAWLLAELVLGSTVLYLVGFHLFPWLLRGLGTVAFLLLAPALAFAATLAWTPAALLLAVLVKKLLIGRYRPARVPVWSGFFVRNWIVQQVVRLMPWSLLAGTVFTNVALRALGAKIGRRVHIHRGVNLLQGGWDLLTLGDDVTLSQDAAVRVVDLDDGHLVLGPVSIGDGSTLETRAGMSAHAEMGRGALLTALSWLPPGCRVADGECWDGVPAAPAGPAPAPPPLPDTERLLSPVAHGLLLVGARLAWSAALSVPFLGLAAALVAALGLDAAAVLDWLFAGSFEAAVLLPAAALVILATPAYLLLTALALRGLGSIGAATVSRWSRAYIRIWLKAGAVDAAGEWLSGTLFWPRWLRLAGMRIGRKCEVSSIIDVVPERITVGEESFLADGIYLGGPRICRGAVAVASTGLGRNTFVGNHAVIAAGQQLADDVLLGVCTTADDRRVREGSSWFGHPAFALPRREVVACERELTHDPGLPRLLTRLFWETLRFALPLVPLLTLLCWFKAVAWSERAGNGAALSLLVVTAATLAAAAALCLLVLGLKWLLLGRVRPGVHPLWSCWCSRWDFLYVAWMFLARATLTTLEGTLFLACYLRAMGARVGRRVVLGAGFAQVVDPDMLHFDDGATVNGQFQAHTFEDRVLKIDRVRIRRDATAGAAAVLFYGADVGERTWISPHSVVMKRERLTAARRYMGCPTRPA